MAEDIEKVSSEQAEVQTVAEESKAEEPKRARKKPHV